MCIDAQLETELVALSQPALAAGVRERGQSFDVREARMLRTVLKDFDHNGKEELCFIVGVPEFGGPALCGLGIPKVNGGYDAITLIPFEYGFRELSISDIDKDGILEIITTWQADFGLYLTVNVTRWDGQSIQHLFPSQHFHQGLMEMKDIDADGLDEILVWSGRYERNPRWFPQYFDLHIFGYNNQGYELRKTRRTDHPYHPGPFLGQKIGVAGLPEAFYRPPPPMEQRRRLEKQKSDGMVSQHFINELSAQHMVLTEERFYQDALEIADLALEGAEHLTLTEAEKRTLLCEVLFSKAVTCTYLGLWRQSIEAYKKAIQLYALGALSDKDPLFGPTRQRELGFMYYRVGNYAEALRQFSIAKEHLEKANLPEDQYKDESARIKSFSGFAHAALGEHEIAKEAFLEAANLHEQLRRFPQAAISLTGLGNILRDAAYRTEGSYEYARRTYQSALDMLNGVEGGDRDVADRKSDVYLELGRTLLLDEKPGPALSFLEKALLLTSAFNLLQHAAIHYLYIGEAYTRLGNLPEAERYFRKATQIAQEYGTPETLWQSLYRLALVQEANGRLTECKETLRASIKIIEALRSQYLPEAMKISMISGKEEPYEKLVGILCQFSLDGAGDSGAQVPEEAFKYVQLAKSRVFTEQLAKTDLGDVAGLSASLVEEERSLVHHLRALQAEHKTQAAQQSYDWGEEILRTEDRLRTLWKEIQSTSRKGAEYVSLREATSPNYTQVRSILADSSGTSNIGSVETRSEEDANRVILLEYFVLQDRVLLFVGCEELETPRVYEIDIARDTLSHWAFILGDLEVREPHDLADWNLDEWQSQLKLLVQPVERWSEEGDTLWIVPHGDLHLLPLHALEVNGRYIIDRNPVCYSPNVSTMVYSKTKGSGVLDSALVFGDSLSNTEAPEPLPAARREAEIVASLFGTQPYLGDKATKRTLQEELAKVAGKIDLLHLACHGKFLYSQPLKSYIALASSDAESSNLTAEDILGLVLNAELVTLSACESGISQRRVGDELIGLTRSFLYAGTPSLVASLWSVNDRSTGTIMEHFYRSLRHSVTVQDSSAPVSKARALQQAQQYVKDLSDFEHPYYWSPFVLIGDWQ